MIDIVFFFLCAGRQAIVRFVGRHRPAVHLLQVRKRIAVSVARFLCAPIERQSRSVFQLSVSRRSVSVFTLTFNILARALHTVIHFVSINSKHSIDSLPIALAVTLFFYFRRMTGCALVCTVSMVCFYCIFLLTLTI